MTIFILLINSIIIINFSLYINFGIKILSILNLSLDIWYA